MPSRDSLLEHAFRVLFNALSNGRHCETTINDKKGNWTLKPIKWREIERERECYQSIDILWIFDEGTKREISPPNEEKLICQRFRFKSLVLSIECIKNSCLKHHRNREKHFNRRFVRNLTIIPFPLHPKFFLFLFFFFFFSSPCNFLSFV